QSPSCRRTSNLGRPVLILVGKISLPAEFEQWIAVLRKWRRLSPQLRRHPRVVEHRIPDQVRQEHFHQRRSTRNRPFAIRQTVHGSGERPLQHRNKQWPTFLLRRSQRGGQFTKRLRLPARR